MGKWTANKDNNNFIEMDEGEERKITKRWKAKVKERNFDYQMGKWFMSGEMSSTGKSICEKMKNVKSTFCLYFYLFSGVVIYCNDKNYFKRKFMTLKKKESWVRICVLAGQSKYL